MKYIVVQAQQSGKEEIYLFPEHIDHDKFAEVLSHIREGEGRDWHRQFRKPIAAGFTDGRDCFGRSDSLNLDSRLQDKELLE